MRSIYKIIYIAVCIIVCNKIQESNAALDINSRLLLAKAVAEGKKTVDLMLVTRDGGYDNFLDYISALGFTIKFEAKELGYIRVDVPLNKVEVIIDHQSIISAGVDLGGEPFVLNNKSPISNRAERGNNALNKISRKRAFKDDPLDFEAMGLISLRKTYPHADGRGITIALIEEFIDPVAPEMEFAKNISGMQVPKILGIYESNSYMNNKFSKFVDSPVLHGVKLVKLKANASREVTFAGQRMQLPSPGWYWVGAAVRKEGIQVQGRENSAPSNENNDLGIIIARKEEGNCFIVDLNKNKDLTDDVCIADFNHSRQASQLSEHGPSDSSERFWILTTEQPEWIIVGRPKA